MAELTQDFVDRAIGWCALAGRHTTEKEVRAALSPLTWDQVLAATALLADPPSARPLGPMALADIARGASPDLAAERERDGQYRSESSFERQAAPAPSGRAGARPPPPGVRVPVSRDRRRSSRQPGVTVRRARDRTPAPSVEPPPLPLLADLFAAEGRALLERLFRKHGARRATIVSELAANWRRPDGAPVGPQDLHALLEFHGLHLAFQRRERDLALHALRAARAVRAHAAAALGIDAAAFADLLTRVAAQEEAEAIRAENRRAVLAHGTLSERVHQLLQDEERLFDLGLLDEIEKDLRARLPEHVRALRAAGERSLAVALGRSLSLSRAQVEKLAARFTLDLGFARDRRPPPPRRPHGTGAALAKRHAHRPTRPHSK